MGACFCDYLLTSTLEDNLKASEQGRKIALIRSIFMLNKMDDYTQKPVFISKDGLETRDILEEEHLIDNRYRINQAIEDGVDVIGYIMCGIIYVDADNEGNVTYKRYKKDSFKCYKDL